MKKDLKEYYVSLQKQYNELQKALEEINKEIAEGKVASEQKASFENYFNIVQTNYQRISYAMHLLNKPPKFIQKWEDKKALKEQNKLMEEFKKQNATSEQVLAENQEALDKLKEAIPKEEECHSETL